MNLRLDGIVRDVRYAWRSFLRAPVAAVTIVLTIALGLGLVAAVFTILNLVMFRVDGVRDPHELFAVEREQAAVAQPRFTRDDYDALLRDTRVFSAAFATTADVAAWIEGVRREGRMVTGNFFGVLGVGAERGRAFTPADDAPGQPAVIVLSHRAWTQQYQSDPGVVGRVVRVNGAQFEIIGVMPESFRGLELAAPDFWSPLAQLEQFNEQDPDGPTLGFDVIGRLAPQVSQAQALAQLAAWDSQRTADLGRERAATGLVLTPRLGTMPQPADALLVFIPLLFAFGLILLMGCANVANLLLARLVARQREIGIRLSIGASRRRIVWQLLTESLLLALLSAAVAFVVSRVVLTGTVYWLTSSFPPEIGNLRIALPPADWRVVLFLVGGALVATVLFALAPALQATRVEVVRAIHGQVLGSARPARARNALLVLQVTGSALLLVCAAIFLRSGWAAASIDPGIRIDGIINVSVLTEPRRAAVLDAVRTDASVEAVAGSWPGALSGLGGIPAYGEGASGRSVVSYQFVSPEYFGVLDIDVVRGRGFADSERNPNEGIAIVSETVARELWPGADALGQTLRVDPDPALFPQAVERPGSAARLADPLLQPRTAVVVGIARDVAGLRLGGFRVGDTGVYMPIAAEAPATALIARVRGDVNVARRGLVDRLAAVDPNMAEVGTLETIASAEGYIFGIVSGLTTALGSLALFLTLSGLFSVLSYLVEQRTAEIGVRMALGASRARVGALVLLQSARPIVLGLVIGAGLTAGVGALLLATPLAEQIGEAVLLFDAIAYAGSLLLIVAACAGAALLPALRATRINPLAALRQD